ncbi:MAG TPA: pseudouridine synthase, partial [Chloroflexota bacterium]
AVTGFRYYLVYKPVGYVTTVRDPQGRPTVMDLIPRDVRVYPVGRLDIDSEGLVLLTNDGQLAYRLMHPRYGVEKEYRVLVEGRLSDQALDRLRRGVVLDDGVTSPARVDVLGRESDRTWLRVVLHEGRKRQVRRMIAAVGGRVERLVRVRLGPLRIGKLRPGQHRPLTPVEVQTLWQGWRHGSTDGGSD